MMDNLAILYSVTILFLILVSAFFSCAETAITTVSRAKIYQLSKEGNKQAVKVEVLLRHSESLIGTLLLSNNVVNILASAMATSFLIKSFGEAEGVVYATVIMTVLILIFGEIAPKTYALKNSEKIALSSSTILIFLVKILYPLTRAIQKIINNTINFFSSKKKSRHHFISDLDEIRGAIDLKHKAGSIFKYDKDMIHGILDLGEIEISDIMTYRKNIKSINIEQNISEIINQAFKINHSKIPLWKVDPDNIVMILSMQKLIKILHKNYGNHDKIALDDITYKPWFVPSSNSLRNQLLAFLKKKKRLAIVIDEYGALMGLVTLEDILEEIVGDIDNKKVNGRSRIVKLKDGGYKIPGEMLIREINRKLNWELQEDDNSSTLAGLLISRIERIPGKKESFEFDGYSFKVLEKKQHKVTIVKVGVLSKGQDVSKE